MGAAEFGHLVRTAIDAKGLSQGAVGRRVTKRLPDDRGLDATQVRLVMEGRRRLDRALVDAFCEVLGLDPFEAYEAADLRPEGFTAEDHRVFAGVGGATRTATTALPERRKSVLEWKLATAGGRVLPFARPARNRPVRAEAANF